ncbi:MAG: hypothetical protein R6U66_11365 [Bacteroidales bacterium]
MKKNIHTLFTAHCTQWALSLAILLASLSSCQPSKDSGNLMHEGYIEYSITYLDDTLDNFMLKFLPNKMIVKFKDYHTINKIQGLSGVVSFTQIQDLKEKTSVTLVHLLNKQYRYNEPHDAPPLFYDNLSDLTITPTGNTKEICGIICAEARVETSDPSFTSFPIYYTEKLQIPNVNTYTPYNQVEGVLMEFQLKLYDVRMKFTANVINESKIPKSEFEIPQDYKPINRETMEEIMSLLK